MMDATVDSLQVAEAGRKGVWLGRLLEEEETNKTALIINATKASDSEILRNTFSSYGSALLIVFLLFCFLRLRYPRVYNLRNWIPERRSDLAKRQYGFFSWFWKLYQIPDEQICDECGMDAVCFVRLCSMGLKLCGMGMVSALWLMPLYRTATLAEETNGINDEIVMLTTANLSSGSNRFLATVFSAYCIFGFTIYLILTEFRWFTAMRHRFLMKPMARSYAVYVRNIAPAYQTNLGIKIFFEKCLPGVEVLESHICMKTSGIQKEVAKREATVLKLEHAVAEEEEYGVTPKHRADKSGVLIPGLYGIGKEVNSIDYYAAELCKQNEDINARTSKIRKIASQELPYILESDNESTKNLSYDDGEGLFSFVRANTIDVAKAVADNAAAVTTGATDLVAKAATDAAKLVLSNEDGEIYSAGFVVFKKLSTTHAALQMIHHEKPYSMEVLAAPAPEDILWSNVGRQHKDLQLGKLVSTAATIVACLLWTIPVSFVSSLSSVEGLRKEISFIDQMLDAMPSLEPIFELLAPQFLVILNALLPVILEIFTKFEGPISGAMVEASLFVKLAAFMIIQTFFVSALSGSIISELSKLLEDTSAIVDLLADSLPTQSTFFLQMALVMTTSTFAIESLRVVPIAMATLRRCIGPNLTPRERGMTVMGIRPLSDGADFPHANFLSNMVLFFMILLVYSCIAPLVSVVVGLCFAALGALFRHQFVYIYPRNPDSGGYLWLNFIQILTTCLLFAEITVVGMLALKKATIATPLMFPLIIATALFSFYIRQEHFRIAQYLPTHLSLRKDSRNSNIDIDYSFVQEAYLQPELRERVVLPELSTERITELGIGAINEINSSKVDDDEEAAAAADDDDDSLGSGPPTSCVVAKNPWIEPHESELRKGLSCRALVIGSGGEGLGDEGRFEDVSMMSED